MKIGIVTVYQSYNCGSFLQAYAMQRTLEEFGCKPQFIKTKQTLKSRLWYRMFQAAKYVCSGKPKRARHLLKAYKNFHKAQRKLSIVTNYAGVEAAVYGSDTIWNIDQKPFLKNWRRFCGADFGGRKIAYAASVGSAQQEELLSHKEICDAITQFDAIAVRDQATRSFVQACFGENRQIGFVVDPTMLQPVQMYDALAPQIDKSGYILFYYFGAIPEKIRKQARDFADRTGRKIIVFGENVGWADQYVSNDPFLMLSYYKNADYVITNTFHGNVFCLIFNKQFVSFGKEKQKVRDLLERFGLTDRLAHTDDALVPLFDKWINYEKTNEKLEIFRAQSRQYLHDAIFKNEDMIK